MAHSVKGLLLVHTQQAQGQTTLLGPAKDIAQDNQDNPVWSGWTNTPITLLSLFVRALAKIL